MYVVEIVSFGCMLLYLVHKIINNTIVLIEDSYHQGDIELGVTWKEPLIASYMCIYNTYLFCMYIDMYA